MADETLADILERLPIGTPLLVPDELINLWFPPGVVGGVIAPESVIAAEVSAAQSNCDFVYVADEQAGRFTKRFSPN